MNKRGQFSIIAALLVAVILIATVIITYSTIRNDQVQSQPVILSAIDETNLAVKQVLGFTIGYYGSILQVTGNQSYAETLAMGYLQSGLLNIASMNPQWGTSFNVNNSGLITYWYTNSSYSTGNLAVNYNLTGLGISGITYQTSCKLSVNATSTGTNQARLDIMQDDNTPIVNLGIQNFQFYSYYSANSSWLKIPPTDEPLSYANGTYLIDTPSGVDPYSFLVQVEDPRGIIVVASSFSRLVYDLNFTGWNTTAYTPTIPNSTWWNNNYSYRRLITITNNAASSLTSGYSCNMTLDTASLVSAGKMLLNGNDLRIVNWNGNSWTEIDRDIISGTMDTSATQVWFRTQATIGPSPSAANDYYLYYGDPSATNPPANKSNVYLWFDDFNRANEPSITTEPAYTQTNGGTWSIVNDTLENVGDPNHGDPCKLLINALGTVNHDVEMVIKIDVAQFGGGDYGRMGLSSNMDPSGQGYCALLHNDQNSLDLLNDLRSWGTHTTYSWTTNTWYYMKFRVINPGSNDGKVKIWPVGSSEPSVWTVDGNFGGGQTRGYGMVGIAGSRQPDVTYFDDLQVRYIVDPEPSVSLGQEEIPPGLPRPYLAPAHVQDATITVELLQDGTMRWLGQSLQMTTEARPFPPIPIKAIHVNQTSGGVSSEVPFQVEDWASGYTIPLGLTSNASVFGDRNMLVFLANPGVTEVTIWWNGSDTATQTPYAYTNRYFNDNPTANTLSNGLLTLQLVNPGSFTFTSTVGGSSVTTNFMRVNQQWAIYGSDEPAYVIYNGIVRDIIRQEPEWGGGVSGCPDFYGYIVLTLPANATYFTYQLSLIYLNTQQSRTVTDLYPISVTGLTGQPQVENGVAGGYPIVSNSTGLFYNSSSVWQHHWSQFIQGTKGAGIMFTNASNQELYTFDNIAGKTTGALSVNPSGTMGLMPVTTAPASFNYSMNVIWYGAVVTFDGTTPIYNNSDQTGLWMLVEQPPIITPSTES
ncbi:MAG TPA: hypothetical protein VEH86_05650 [Candidatus Acidoferrum sp.]|nr:hypothetical protein [Candidatus Acidoferrum sp.]